MNIPHLTMWVPGRLPPNLVFLITVSKPAVDWLSENTMPPLDPRDPIAANSLDEATHLEHADRRQDTVDG